MDKEKQEHEIIARYFPRYSPDNKILEIFKLQPFFNIDFIILQFALVILPILNIQSAEIYN